MNKRLFKILKVLTIVGIMLIAIISICKFVIIKYGTMNLNERKFNMIVSKSNSINPEAEFFHALQWYSNWDNLFLTNHFKEKFKNCKNLASNINDINFASSFRDNNYLDGKLLIGVYGNKKKSILDVLNPDYIDIDRSYYFDYKVDENGYLDDVELVGHQDFDAETGFLIE